MAEFTPKSILVTGAAGFFGSHLVDRLLTAFPVCNIVVLDIMDPTCANVKNLESAMSTGRVRLIRGDIRSFDLVTHILQQFSVDCCVLNACRTHVDNSMAGNSLEFTSTNVGGTHVCLEAIRQFNYARQMSGGEGVRKVLVTISDEVFGESKEGDPPHTEDAPFLCTNPYSSSKCGQAALCMSYISSHRLPLIFTYPNNMCAPRQSIEKMVPKFIMQRSMNPPKKLTIHGSGEQKRSFLHPLDVAEAFVILLQKGEVGQSYNIGSEVEITVNEVAHLVLKHFGVPPHEMSSEIVHVRNRLFNDSSYRINSSKMRALGWAPTRDFERDILPEMVSWYRTHQDWWPEQIVQRLIAAHPPRSDEVQMTL